MEEGRVREPIISFGLQSVLDDGFGIRRHPERAGFTKSEAVISLSEDTPTSYRLSVNAHALASWWLANHPPE